MVRAPTAAKQKLEAFERLQSEFEASFHFVQEVHGQRRFSAFPVMETATISMHSGSVNAKTDY